MGRWHSIVARKTAGDQNKGKVYAKVGKIITIAAKKWADPDLNPSLALALQKAKQNNLPRDVIDRAIKKWAGWGEGDDLQEIFYEWYGPGGVAIYIKAITSNTNRSATNVKIIVNKHGGNMGTPGSVSWQFQHKGVIVVDGLSRKETIKWKEVEHVDPYDAEQLEMDAMEYDIIDIEKEWDTMVITTSLESYRPTLDGLQQAWYHVATSDLHYIPDNTVAVDDEDKLMLDKLLAALDDDEDVDLVAHNAN